MLLAVQIALCAMKEISMSASEFKDEYASKLCEFLCVSLRFSTFITSCCVLCHSLSFHSLHQRVCLSDCFQLHCS